MFITYLQHEDYQYVRKTVRVIELMYSTYIYVIPMHNAFPKGFNDNFEIGIALKDIDNA